MNELIAVIDHEGKPAINARDLHQRLEVGRDFSTWIKDRIEKCGFVEGEGYSPNLGNRSDGLPGKPRTDYLLTVTSALIIVAGENTDKQPEILKYLTRVLEAWNTPEAVRLRAIQLGAIPNPAMAPVHKVAESVLLLFLEAFFPKL
jgi:anti-repressor protein